MRPTALLLGALLVSTPLLAQRVEPEYVSSDVLQQRTAAPPPYVVRTFATGPLLELAPAAEDAADQIEEVLAWNRAGRSPARNGFTRDIGAPIHATVGGAAAQSGGGGIVRATDHGTVVWGASVTVDHASRLRLHLTNVSIPPDAHLWVYGEDGAFVAFGNELLDANGEMYTPSIEGQTISLEVEIAAGTMASFDIADIVELLGPASSAASAAVPQDSPSCLIDATCVSASQYDSIDALRSAVAQLEFVVGSSSFVCSGGLINDTDRSTYIPYLLTAHHCISSQASASSLEAFFDYRTSSCGGAAPSWKNSPRSNGAQLLATSSGSDFTFLRLTSVPPGRWFMGWNADSSAIRSGTTLYRVSHPYPDSYINPAPQKYSYANVTTTWSACSPLLRPNFIYSLGGGGGTYGGSSGSPVLLPGGYIVGQLYGVCGTNISAGCDRINNANIDGAFSATYPSIRQYLSPTTTSAGCVASTTVACMLNNRFKVEVKYRNGFDNNAADTTASVKSVSGMATSTYETAFFYFNSSSNIEFVIKMLDQGDHNSSGQPTIDILTGVVTPLRVEVRVTDTANGHQKVYATPYNTQAGVTDFSAFVK